jgi:hypothetical protein
MEVRLSVEQEAAIVGKHGSLAIIQRYAENEANDILAEGKRSTRAKKLATIFELSDDELDAVVASIKDVKPSPVEEAVIP